MKIIIKICSIYLLFFIVDSVAELCNGSASIMTALYDFTSPTASETELENSWDIAIGYSNDNHIFIEAFNGAQVLTDTSLVDVENASADGYVKLLNINDIRNVIIIKTREQYYLKLKLYFNEYLYADWVIQNDGSLILE